MEIVSPQKKEKKKKNKNRKMEIRNVTLVTNYKKVLQLLNL